jgi:hypothetical protein
VDHKQTYEEWREWVITRGADNANWQVVGDWFFPTPRNNKGTYKDTRYHLCEPNWRTAFDVDADPVAWCTEACEACGTEIPEGIKMIAMLLSW